MLVRRRCHVLHPAWLQGGARQCSLLLSLLKNDADHTFDKEDRVFQSRNERFLKGQKVHCATLRSEPPRSGKEGRRSDAMYTDEYLPIQVARAWPSPPSCDKPVKNSGRMGSYGAVGSMAGLLHADRLAHGSNLSALRTTATLDLEKVRVVINTPEPSSGKVWIWRSGLTATYGVVMATSSSGQVVRNCTPSFPSTSARSEPYPPPRPTHHGDGRQARCSCHG